METVDPNTGEIMERTTLTATGTLAGLLDSTNFREQLRDLDHRIDEADQSISMMKENLKIARGYREKLVDELRAVARGERALPFTQSPTKE